MDWAVGGLTVAGVGAALSLACAGATRPARKVTLFLDNGEPDPCCPAPIPTPTAPAPAAPE